MDEKPTPAPQKPRNFEEAYKKFEETSQGETAPAPPQQDALMETGDEAAEAEMADPVDTSTPARDPEIIPAWCIFPEDPKWKIPPGKQLGVFRFRAAWTDRPDLGDRVCVMFSLSDTEEKLAIKRTRGDNGRTLTEMSKGIIRAMGSPDVPLVMADWTGKLGPGNVDRFWNDIGPKCRVLIQNFYLRTHSLSQEELADFFQNCMVVKSAVAG